MLPLVSVMARQQPTLDTLRALFARSGNRCSFPGCDHRLVNETNHFIGQICHIQAANPRGQRYNPDQTDDERRAYDNLILLCYPHHVETNDVSLYPVRKLMEIKHVHESSYSKESYVVDESVVNTLSTEMDEYWSDIELLNTIKHIIPDLAVPIAAKGTFFNTIRQTLETLNKLDALCQSVRVSDESLDDDVFEFLGKCEYDTSRMREVPYFRNPFIGRNWEVHNLGLPNCFNTLRMCLVQLEIQYLQEYLKTNSTDRDAARRFNILKIEFRDIAQSAILAD